ncbi:hypothetical protein ONE63_004350 [Megalurothrips usitatus]|uniref:Secreted protein n=1 Tax=Megalurothrips usitatus TaxID=439358 RepID=A0AAV7X6R8_9NEOP|nr:hypothetical protein ONE63_004350 [Megalurothrips usitatus]
MFLRAMVVPLKRCCFSALWLHCPFMWLWSAATTCCAKGRCSPVDLSELSSPCSCYWRKIRLDSELQAKNLICHLAHFDCSQRLCVAVSLNALLGLG